MILPFALEMHKVPVLVVGAGTVGLRKIKTLLQAGASVMVAEPAVDPPDWFCGRWEKSRYRESFLDNMMLVFACTNDADLNATICRQARERNIFACNASSSKDRTLSSMAYFIHDSVMVSAISVCGDVNKSIKTKEMLYAYLTELSSGEKRT